jgi:DNA-binding transcriptional LysR family regulator
MSLGHPHGEMEAFVRAIELGGFSKAAREFGLTPSAVSKLVTRLERRLGMPLVSRTTRKLTLTSEGALYLERCRRILLDIEDAENEVARARVQPRGSLRLHVGVAFGTHQLVPVLPRFIERYPEIHVELIVDDRTVDLAKEGADIGIRTGPLRDPSLVARKLCEFERVICASPAYIGRRGMPETPADLARHDCINIAGIASLSKWPFRTSTGVEHIDVRGSVIANNAECVLQLALLGHGIIRMNEMAVSEYVRDGRLLRLLTDTHHAEAVPLNAVFPPGRQRVPRVAVMLDFLMRTFGHSPWRTPRAKTSRANGRRRGKRPASL